jgi:hypothetical protein
MAGSDIVELRLGGEPFARYRFGPELARPHFDALFGPGGRRVTRDARPGSDHPHHRGVWAGHRDVDGVDHWTEFAGHGRIVHRAFDAVDDSGFSERLDWLDPAGRPMLAETRTARVHQDGAMDLDLRLQARDGAVTLRDTKDAALLAVRVAATMRAIENADGGRGEAECWGRRAAWCDVSGPVDGAIVGVAALDHPSNPRHPPPWHVRDYGLLAANPFGLRALEVSSAPPDGSMRLEPGADLVFRYRLIVHAGDAAAARIADRYREYAR